MNEIQIRDITEADIENGLLETLACLTTVGDIQLSDALQRLQEILNNPNHCIKVATVGDKVIACGTILIEPKFIHTLGSVAHLEDVVVHTDYQKQGIGKKIIQELLSIAQKKDCYKVLLDCTDELQSWYETVHFEGQHFFRQGTTMRMNLQ